MKYVTDRMEDDSLEGDIICRRCENADYEFDEDFIMKTVDMQETLTYLYDKLGSNNKVLKIVDMLGREVHPSNNIPLFYIYENGEVKKFLIR